MKIRTCAFVAVSCVTGLLSGCSSVAGVLIQSVVHKSPTVSVAAAVDTNYTSSLNPSNSGNGLLVFEPVTPKASSTLVAWGSGLSRWAQLHAGGQGELGKTPSWALSFELQRRFKLANLRVDLPTAIKMGQLTGASHILTSQLTGKPDNLNFRLSLYNLAAQSSKSHPTVASWILKGTPAKIQADFPAFASDIAQTLGSPEPSLSKKLNLNQADLEFLGRLPLKLTYAQYLPAPQTTRLKKLVTKDALAGVMAERLCVFDNSAWKNLSATMLEQAPRNAIVWREIGYYDAARLQTKRAVLEELGLRYPNNFLINQALMSLASVQNRTTQEIGYAEKSVKAAPQNSLAWYFLAESQADAAQKIRQGRYASDISDSEFAQLDRIYAKAQAAALKATQVDPQNTYAWSKLSVEATFNGDSNTAYAALEKALSLDPANNFAWDWGLQLTQPKWFGSRSRFREFALRAARNSKLFYFDASVISNERIGLSQAEIKEILEVAVKSNPRGVRALQKLAEHYEYHENNFPRAEQLYRQALAVAPDDHNSISGLADLIAWSNHDPKAAEDLYQKAIASFPEDGYLYGNLGQLLAQTGHMAEGKAMAQKAKTLGLGADHPVWEATGVSPP